MDTGKVGQKVRVVNNGAHPYLARYVGSKGTIVEMREDWGTVGAMVRLDQGENARIGFYLAMLEPIGGFKAWAATKGKGNVGMQIQSG